MKDEMRMTVRDERVTTQEQKSRRRKKKKEEKRHDERSDEEEPARRGRRSQRKARCAGTAAPIRSDLFVHTIYRRGYIQIHTENRDTSTTSTTWYRYWHTHFFSDSLLPTRVACPVNVSFNTSLDTLGNLSGLARAPALDALPGFGS